MSMSPATILVVDNDPAVADAFRSYLRDRYRVRVAYDGEVGLRRFDEDVEVVLLDRRMPNVSGDEVLEHIRSRDRTCQVAMVTAVDPDFDIVDMEFDDYVQKPVSEEELLDTVEGLLQRQTYGEKLQAFYTAAKKFATLQTEKTEAQLSDNDEYARLKARLVRLREEVDEAIQELNEWEGFDIAVNTFSADS